MDMLRPSLDSQRLFLFDYSETVLPPDAFETLLCGSTFDKTPFCLGQKQGKLVNDECSSWYNRCRRFLVSIWNRRKQLLYTDGSAWMTQRINPTPPE